MSSAPLSTTETPLSLATLRAGCHICCTKEANSSSYLLPQIQQTARIHRLADGSAPCTDTTISRLHDSDGHREPNEEGFRFVVQIIGAHPVALGGYPDIWQGWLKNDSSSTRELVAVKVLRHFGGNASQRAFFKHLQREVRIWSLLSHENIALFYGIVYHSDNRPAMISPWYSNGSADVYLRNHPSINPIKLIWEITSGVEYLHEHGVVHGDLKGANVMIDDKGHAKLIDFGLSRLLEGPSGFTLSTMSFSIRWCAPELLLVENAQVTAATDVYSLASTTLQFASGGHIFMMIFNKLSPQRPTSPLRYSIRHVESLWDLLEVCRAEEQRRPSISEVKDRLRRFYQ